VDTIGPNISFIGIILVFLFCPWFFYYR